jgi:hypothetical protein
LLVNVEVLVLGIRVSSHRRATTPPTHFREKREHDWRHSANRD